MSWVFFVFFFNRPFSNLCEGLFFCTSLFTILIVAVTLIPSLEIFVKSLATVTREWERYQIGVRFIINGSKSKCLTLFRILKPRDAIFPPNTRRYLVLIKARFLIFSLSKLQSIFSRTNVSRNIVSRNELFFRSGFGPQRIGRRWSEGRHPRDLYLGQRNTISKRKNESLRLWNGRTDADFVADSRSSKERSNLCSDFVVGRGTDNFGLVWNQIRRRR